jgi:hypothetical protein
MIKIKIADNYFKRLIGLMFKRDIDYGLMIILKYGFGIHTCFMFFTIDVYFLDENRIVIEKVRLKPWRYYKPSKKAKYVLEVKEKTLNLNINEKFDF